MHQTISSSVNKVKDEQILSGELQLKEFSQFIESHDSLLNNLFHKSFVITDDQTNKSHEQRNSLLTTRKSKGALKPNTTPIWSSKVNVISPLKQCIPANIDFNQPYEAIPIVDLVATENRSLQKVIAVLVQLCMEVRQLTEEGNVILTNCLFVHEEICNSMHSQNSNGFDGDSTNLDGRTNDLNSDCLINDVESTFYSILTTKSIVKISKLLDFLCEAQYFLERCFIVINEIISQLAALFAAEDKYYINVNNSTLHFQTVFNYLAEATVLIIKFDNIFKSEQLQYMWTNYTKSIQLLDENFDKFNDHLVKTGQPRYNSNDFQGLKSILYKLEYLFTGDLFQNLIDNTYNLKRQISSQALPLFSFQFQSYLKNILGDIQMYLTNVINLNNNKTPSSPTVSSSVPSSAAIENVHNLMAKVVLEPTKLLIKLNAMAMVYHYLFGNLDQKLFSAMIDCNTKLCCITLMENVVWSPEIFLQRYANTLLGKIRGSTEKFSPANIEKIQQTWLNTKCQRLTKDTQFYGVQVTLWIIKMRALFKHDRLSQSSTKSPTNDLNSFNAEDLYQKVIIIIQGIELMETLSSTINSVTNLHVHLKSPMTRQSIVSICKLIEFLKIIKLQFTEYSPTILLTAQCVTQYQMYQVLSIVSSAKKKLLSDSSSTYNERTIDILSAIELAETVLFGTPNIKRVLVARLALSMTDPKRLFTADQLNKICSMFVSIEHFIQLKQIVGTLSTSSFMYWHQEVMLPIYLRNILDQTVNTDCERMMYIFHSAMDSHNEMMVLNQVNFNCSIKFMKEMASLLNRIVISKLCGYIETKLRLDVHANLQLLGANEVESFAALSSTASETKTLDVPNLDWFRLIQLKPIHIAKESSLLALKNADRYLALRDHISIYLSQMFYNSTTLSMYDWRKYGEMRCLAQHKFQLNTIEDYLPTQTLEQGLDVLEIMRNIHLFVSRYLYNLNNQIFIEKNSNNKHLNTINIRHIANSLRTHGTGIINTTVNFTYQFLRRKFYIFSQFLYNEHIQSRLLKDLKSFREANLEKPEEHQMYSYEKANGFKKGIRRLGLSDTGQSSLDLFRQLITHIGNAMGYVRMMRSGSIHCSSNASVYLPIVSNDFQFQEICKESKLSAETIESAKNLECDISHLIRNYSEGTEYFRLLVDAFSSFFRSDKNPHLKLFYLIVPPLTINYVEYIIMAKEKMNKKAKQDGTWFTDDGFAMGLAYVLKLLNQTSEFNSLHWFKAVRQKYSKEIIKLDQIYDSSTDTMTKDPNIDAKLQQTLALSEKRINMILQEFDLLYCNLSSAKIFFQ